MMDVLLYMYVCNVSDNTTKSGANISLCDGTSGCKRL